MHLFSPTGFLDDTWWHRSYWVFGRSFSQGAGGWPHAGRFAPGGRILSFNDTTVYGYGRRPDHYTWTTPLEYHLFAASRKQKAAREPLPEPPVAKPAAKAKKAQTAQAKKPAARKKTATAAQTAAFARQFELVYQWSQAVPLQVRAMVLTPESLFIAGPPDILDEEDAFARIANAGVQERLREQDAALAGKKGFSLWAVGLSDGQRLAEHHLDSLPVFDGMIAAAARLYIVTTDGKVHCFQPL
jgi:hypothetical protein